jgi:hypothetical protein
MQVVISKLLETVARNDHKIAYTLIDGWLCPIQVPPKSIVGNAKTYFLGHYQHHRFNIQVIVDHVEWFLYIVVAAPESQPDVNALHITSIHSLLKGLSLGYFLLGDTSCLEIIFGGAN